MILRLFSACVLAWLILSASAPAQPLRVFAAASLTTALEEIARDFTRETGHAVSLSAAGSSVLARQIAAGAPADVFISANAAWMDDLEGQDLIEPGTRFDLVGNALVLIASARQDSVGFNPSRLAKGIGSDRLAVALVDAVPAGIYAKAALRALAQWDALQSNLVQTDNVRAALALVALGAAPYGIVYASDAIAEPRVQVLLTFDPELHPPITYPVAVMSNASSPEAARAFQEHLRSTAAQAVLKAQGFSLMVR